MTGFEWDFDKAEANFRKHGVRFSESISVFEDDYALTVRDDVSDRLEERFVTLGRGAKDRLLVVVYCSGVETSGSSRRVWQSRMSASNTRMVYETAI
jgi:uncharacterized DUF497 family protein